MRKELKLNWLSLLSDSDIKLYGLNKIIYDMLTCIIEKEGTVSKANVAKRLKVSLRTVYYWRTGQRPIQISMFLKLMVASGYTQDHVYSLINANEISVSAGSGSRRRKVALPLTLSKDISYLIGCLFGDGCLFSRQWAIAYVDEYKVQVERIKSLFEGIFKVKCRILSEENCHTLIIYSKPVSLFIEHLFGLPRGEKKDKLRFPKIITGAGDEYAYAFVRGFFDTDGGVPRVEDKILKYAIHRPQIELSQHSKEILEDINSVLQRTNIYTTGPYFNKCNDGFRLMISGKRNIFKCREFGIFKHPIKVQRLDALCKCLCGSVVVGTNADANLLRA